MFEPFTPRLRRLVRVTAAILLFSSATQTAFAIDPVEVRLWTGDAPGATGQESKDVPTLIVYRPGGETGESAKPRGILVILPGGGYGHLAIDHEGHDIARWANSQGMIGAIVSYRHRNRGYGHPSPMLDAQRAIRLVRSKAEDWNVDATKVGGIGFSAGGHLASTVLTHFENHPSPADGIDRLSARPDFGIVCYGVIALGEPFTHAGSQRNLLGKDASPELIRSLSNEKQVMKNTPPCFVWHTVEDKVVDVENSLTFYSALAKLNNGSELHVFPDGRHGLGLAREIPGASQWPALCEDWMNRTVLDKTNGKQ